MDKHSSCVAGLHKPVITVIIISITYTMHTQCSLYWHILFKSISSIYSANQ